MSKTIVVTLGVSLSLAVACLQVDDSDPFVGTGEQDLTARECAGGGGIDYTGRASSPASACRGACGGDCDPDSCSDWSACANGQQTRTCYTLPFCQQHDRCYDCCADSGLGSECQRACDALCISERHPACLPPICRWVQDVTYGAGSGSGSNRPPSSISYHQECSPDPRNAPNCGQLYTVAECAQLAGGYTNSFPEATPMTFTRTCQSAGSGSAR